MTTRPNRETPPEVLEIALKAKEAYAAGLVELYQRRIRKNGPLQYIAQKKHQKRVPLVNGTPWQVFAHQTAEPYKSRDWIRG
jgi:hypothetical protein